MAPLHPIVERLLEIRGIAGEARERFLNPSWRNMPSPADFPGAGEAAEKILDTFQAGGKVVIFGDYDTDGVCAAAILARAFRWINPEWSSACVLPDRFGEGYGLTRKAAERILAENPGVKLVVTVDNGITSADEIENLKSQGVDVIVTDHHLPGDVLPAVPIVNPHVATCPGCENLCGSGVAYYIAWALENFARRRGLEIRKGLAGQLLVLAGLATVADIVPLTGTNRDMVFESLRLFFHSAPAGLRELYRRASRRAGDLTSRDYSHVLSPRLNAAGRMKKADIAYELLMENDATSAAAAASRIDVLSTERRQIESEISQLADAMIASQPGRAAYHVYGEGWHKGVLGIVAGRLSERYNVPVAVSDGELGSIRAPDGINVREALDCCRDLLVRYGGHATACGFQLKPSLAAAFSDAFADACARCQLDTAKPDVRDCDMEIAPGDVSFELWRSLQLLQPFGEGNPEPVFAFAGVAIKDASSMGEDRRHLSVLLDTDPPLRGVWWNHGSAAASLQPGAGGDLHRVVFSVSLNKRSETELTIQSISK